ncbi:MAG: Tad domain-containing protein [Henriciella sp.]|uniref:pilus assembly protein TadG-related protein n=1 Tax=Henriciella sp. TaxID=1968823 RepID=UPI003C7678A3
MLIFLRDTRGAAAMIFALCIIPIMIIVGAAIDFTRHRTATVETQAALDAALLYVAHETGKRPDSELEADAKSLFRREMAARNIDFVYFRFLRDGNSLSANVNVTIETTLLGLAGIQEMNIHRESGVEFNDSRIEMALALDTTGSMRGDKLEQMQDASVLLVNKLAEGTDFPERRKFSLVPFATWVNVDPVNANASWIDKSGASLVSATNLIPGIDRRALYEKLGKTWPGCVEARTYPHDTEDTEPDLSNPETLFTPSFYPDEPDNRYRYPNDYLADSTSSYSILTIIQHIAKYGLSAGVEMTSEPVETKSDYDYYWDITTPIGPGFMCGTRPVIPLTTEAEDITDEIDLLSAEGSTNITEGIAWAWRTLSPTAPFDQGVEYEDDETQKIIVLLSDGNNQIGARSDGRGSDYSAYGYLANGRMNLAYGASQNDVYEEMDKRTLETCQNAKQAGIVIYTIRLELGGDARSEALLEACASSPGHYLDVPDADELEAAFSDIADDVLDLYLSR